MLKQGSLTMKYINCNSGSVVTGLVLFQPVFFHLFHETLSDWSESLFPLVINSESEFLSLKTMTDLEWFFTPLVTILLESETYRQRTSRNKSLLSYAVKANRRAIVLIITEYYYSMSCTPETAPAARLHCWFRYRSVGCRHAEPQTVCKMVSEREKTSTKTNNVGIWHLSYMDFGK